MHTAEAEEDPSTTSWESKGSHHEDHEDFFSSAAVINLLVLPSGNNFVPPSSPLRGKEDEDEKNCWGGNFNLETKNSEKGRNLCHGCLATAAATAVVVDVACLLVEYPTLHIVGVDFIHVFSQGTNANYNTGTTYPLPPYNQFI